MSEIKRDTAAKPAAPSGAAALEPLVRRSFAALVVERLWRIASALVALALLFVAVSWLGLWLELPPLGRALGVFAFIALAAWLVWRELAGGPPTRRDALARLDAAAGSVMRPASSLEDSLAQRDPDAATATLWSLHRRSLERLLRATPVPPPQPDLPRRDPFALRALALVAAAGAAFVAGDEKGARLGAAFYWGSNILGESARVDAWLDPPPYTGRPPLVLEAKDGAPTQLSAPVNSTLHVRGGQAGISGALTPVESEAAEKTHAAGQPAPRERTFKLQGAAAVDLPAGRFELTPIPDRAPIITLTEAPRNNSRGSMSLSYKTEDDYGVVAAEASFSASGSPHALYPPPKLPLTLPAGNAGIGETRATLDVADSPWAGAHASMTLIARDEAGNEGRSALVDITLPQRHFSKALARALAEQRRLLALDPDRRMMVLAALEALAMAPERFDTPSSIYLGLRSARRGLEGRRSDDQLREVADLLWAMALSLEEGDLSQAERDLRAAQRDLREALARGAGEQEISQLTQQLRAALDKFLEGLSQQASRDKEHAPQDGKGRALTEQDLKSILDELAEASKSGDTERAQKLLDQLQDILENLQSAKQGGSGGKSRETQRALSEIDKLSREEQQLRDDTYQGMKSGEEQATPGQSSRGEEGARARQQALRERLSRQRDALRRSGEEALSELGDADKAMKQAEDALGQPTPGGKSKAVDAQGRAVQALRKSADKLAERMKGEGEDEGENGQGQRAGRAEGEGAGRDPLGREAGVNRSNDPRSRYDPLGLPPAVRAHRLQEELRRRLGQPERPTEELDYYERLLKR